MSFKWRPHGWQSWDPIFSESRVQVCFVIVFFPVSTHPSHTLSDHRCVYVTLEEKSLGYQKLFVISYDDKVLVNMRIRVAKSVQ